MARGGGRTRDVVRRTRRFSRGLLARRGGRSADLGFVAEDVEKIFPELVYRDETGQVIGMDDSRLSAVAVQAIKQQQALIRSQQDEIEGLKARPDRLEKLAAPRAR